MRSIATNESNDIFLDANNNLAIAGEDLAMMQTIRHAVLTTAGELQLDVKAGVPYFETVFTDTPDLDTFRQEVQRAAQQVEGVEKVSDFEMQVQNKVLRYSFKVTLNNGREVIING